MLCCDVTFSYFELLLYKTDFWFMLTDFEFARKIAAVVMDVNGKGGNQDFYNFENNFNNFYQQIHPRWSSKDRLSNYFRN